jgi:hypothetical protein
MIVNEYVSHAVPIMVQSYWSLTPGAPGYLALVNCWLETLAVGISLVLHSCAAQTPSVIWQHSWRLLGCFSEPVCRTMRPQRNVLPE